MAYKTVGSQKGIVMFLGVPRTRRSRVRKDERTSNNIWKCKERSKV